jgi:plastocyanin
MLRISSIICAISGLVLAPAAVAAQTATDSATHVIVVKLIERGGSIPYAFEPATVTAVRGDTLRFVQMANAPHNVRFTKQAHGARLGSATTGPYLVAKGQKYDVVIDARFADGTYEYVCDPHEAIGMHGTLVIAGAPLPASTGTK